MPFDPNAAASPESGVFGLPFSPDDSRVVLLPVPFEATTSYGGGTSDGPAAILEASRQVDLFDLETGKPYEAGIAMLDELSRQHEVKLLAKCCTGREHPDRVLRHQLETPHQEAG